MQISDSQVQRVIQKYLQEIQATQKTNRKEISKTDPVDKVEITGKSEEIKKLNQIIKELPEVRADKVKELAEKIKNGEYRIEPDKIAEQMVRRTTVDKLA